MTKAAKISLVVLGTVSVICAAFGLYYNASGVAVCLSGAFHKAGVNKEPPYFYPSFYIMSAICVACYLVLLFCGIAFLRSRVRFVWLFVSVLIFEVIYFFSIGALWLVPRLGLSVAAATGVANGGLTVQFIILFPLWGVILALWTKRRFESAI